MDKIKMPMLSETTLKYVQKILGAHGVRIEVHGQPEEGERYPYWLLCPPDGTKKERDGYVGAYHEQNKITLPDGFIFFQVVDTENWSTISFLAEETHR